MSEVTTADCVKAIVDLAKKDGANLFYKAFEEPASAEDLKNITNPKVWKRITKTTDGDVIERTFDCRPYEDQLRAVVQEKAGVIISVVIQGE